MPEQQLGKDARYGAKEFHAKCQELFRERATWTDIGKLVHAVMHDAINGDAAARNLVWPYIFGAKPSAPLLEIHNNDNRTQTLIWGPAYNDTWTPPALPAPQDTDEVEQP